MFNGSFNDCIVKTRSRAVAYVYIYNADEIKTNFLQMKNIGMCLPLYNNIMIQELKVHLWEITCSYRNKWIGIINGRR